MIAAQVTAGQVIFFVGLGLLILDGVALVIAHKVGLGSNDDDFVIGLACLILLIVSVVLMGIGMANWITGATHHLGVK